MHDGQRLAPMAMVVLQNGHSLVVGAGAVVCSFRATTLMALTSMNTAQATIRKVTTLLMKRP